MYVIRCGNHFLQSDNRFQFASWVELAKATQFEYSKAKEFLSIPDKHYSILSVEAAFGVAKQSGIDNVKKSWLYAFYEKAQKMYPEILADGLRETAHMIHAMDLSMEDSLEQLEKNFALVSLKGN